MTHISLRDKESESSPRMTEFESLDSERRVVPKVFKKVAGHSYACGELNLQTGWSRFLRRPFQAPSLALLFKGVGKTLSAHCVIANQGLVFLFAFFPVAL